MPTVLWIPIGALALGIVGGALVGAGSRGGSAASGALIGGVLALIGSFPLLAIGLSNA